MILFSGPDIWRIQ